MKGQAGLTAGAIMRREVITVRDTWDVREALRVLEENRISGAPVLDADGRLVGVLSVTDIARANLLREPASQESDFYRTVSPDEYPRGFHAERYDAILVQEVMTPLVIDAPENISIDRLAALMVDLHIHRVIITRDSKLVGIVTSLDLLRLVRDGSLVPSPKLNGAGAETTEAKAKH